MSGTMGAVLAAIAAVFATVGFILFGKPKASTISASIPTEKVLPNPVEDKPIVTSEVLPIESEALPVGDSSVDPWADEPAALTLETVEQVELDYASNSPSDFETEEEPMVEDRPEVIELNLDEATQVNEPVQSEFTIPTTRYSSVAKVAAVPMVPQVAAIQDPQRPDGSELQNLSQQILAWGNSGSAEDLKTVMSYEKHPDALIRRYVAVAIGQSAQGTIGPEIQTAIPVLEALTLDSDAKVQKMALKSLNSIQR